MKNGDGGSMDITMLRVLLSGMLVKSFRMFGPYMNEMKTMQKDLKILAKERKST
jgi:hypothetical protein